MTAAVPPPPDAQIFDQGYRRYDGDRTGVPGAIRTVVIHSVRRSLGMGRPARFKIIPVLIIAITFIPAIVFVGIGALLDTALVDDLIPTYAGYYSFMWTAMFLFAAFVAPDLLCTDRRSGMLGVYLASPLNRNTYLLAKTLAVVSMLSILTVGAPVLLLLARTLAGGGPDSVWDFIVLLVRILASGFIIAGLYAAVSLAVSSTTDRSGTATAVTLGILVGSSILAGFLVEGAGYTEKLSLVNLLWMPVQLAFRVHGENGDWNPNEVSTGLIALSFLGVVAFCAAVIWQRYANLLVRR